MILALLLACGEAEQAEPDTCEPGGESLAFLMSRVTLVRAEDGVSEGFDLDGRSSTSGDDQGCGIEDYQSPDGEEGIDNALAELLPLLDATEAVALEPLIADAIQSGQLMLAVELSEVQDTSEDACVDLDIVQGTGAPLVGTDDVVLAGQTIERAPGSVASGQGLPLVAGAVTARPVDLAVNFYVLDALVDLAMVEGAIRIELHQDGTASGLFAGGVDVAELFAFIDGAGIDQSLTDTLEILLQSTADLAPDETGACTRLSVTFAFEAVAVWFYE